MYVAVWKVQCTCTYGGMAVWIHDLYGLICTKTSSPSKYRGPSCSVCCMEETTPPPPPPPPLFPPLPSNRLTLLTLPMYSSPPPPPSPYTLSPSPRPSPLTPLHHPSPRSQVPPDFDVELGQPGREVSRCCRHLLEGVVVEEVLLTPVLLSSAVHAEGATLLPLQPLLEGGREGGRENAQLHVHVHVHVHLQTV